MIARRARAARHAAGRGCGSTACSRRAVPGTVVTGTLTGGVARRRRRSARRPGAHAARVRRIESHNEASARRRAREPGRARTSPGVDHPTSQRGERGRAPGPMGHSRRSRRRRASRRGARRRAPRRVAPSTCTSAPASTRPRCASLDDRRRLRAAALRRSRCRSRRATAWCCDPRLGARRSAGPRCSTSRRPGARRDAPARLGLPLGARVVDARPWTDDDRLVAALTGLDRCRGRRVRRCRVPRDDDRARRSWLVAPVVLARAARSGR